MMSKRIFSPFLVLYLFFSGSAFPSINQWGSMDEYLVAMENGHKKAILSFIGVPDTDPESTVLPHDEMWRVPAAAEFPADQKAFVQTDYPELTESVSSSKFLAMKKGYEKFDIVVLENIGHKVSCNPWTLLNASRFLKENGELVVKVSAKGYTFEPYRYNDNLWDDGNYFFMNIVSYDLLDEKDNDMICALGVVNDWLLRDVFPRYTHQSRVTIEIKEFLKKADETEASKNMVREYDEARKKWRTSQFSANSYGEGLNAVALYLSRWFFSNPILVKLGSNHGLHRNTDILLMQKTQLARKYIFIWADTIKKGIKKNIYKPYKKQYSDFIKFITAYRFDNPGAQKENTLVLKDEPPVAEVEAAREIHVFQLGEVCREWRKSLAQRMCDIQERDGALHPVLGQIKAYTVLDMTQYLDGDEDWNDLHEGARQLVLHTRDRLGRQITLGEIMEVARQRTNEIENTLNQNMKEDILKECITKYKMTEEEAKKAWQTVMMDEDD